MAWRLRNKLRKAPPGADIVADKLEEFEAKMREATAAPRGNMMNAQLTWPVHKLHFQKNRYIYNARYVDETISDALLKHLVKEKIADGPLLAKWRKPGYDSVCSMSVLNRTNTNFGTVGICRTPLKDRTGQIMPNVQTGCVCCVSGSGGPIWWDDPVPDIVKDQILDIDPGKAHLFEEAKGSMGGDGEEAEGVIIEGQGSKLLGNANSAVSDDVGGEVTEGRNGAGEEAAEKASEEIREIDERDTSGLKREISRDRDGFSSADQDEQEELTGRPPTSDVCSPKGGHRFSREGFDVDEDGGDGPVKKKRFLKL